MFDINRTIELIKGGLLDPEATWQAYLAESRNWQETAALLTGPLIVFTAIASWVIRLIFGGGMALGGATTIGALIVTTVFSLLGFVLFAFVLAYLSGVFDGKRGGSVCLNNFRTADKWISAPVMPRPGLVAAR